MINFEYTPEQAREVGKKLFFNSTSDSDDKASGLKLILKAHSMHDPEATYLVARFLLDGILKANVKNGEDYALTLMCSSANNGCIQARAFLNAYCEDRYQEEYDEHPSGNLHEALVDFDGRPIKVNRQGVFTPIDAVLEYKNGSNVLTLSTNVVFLYGDEIKAPERFSKAVIDGILAWQGEYEVFGGQKLTVKVDLSFEDKVYDNLLIIPVTGTVGSTIEKVSNIIPLKIKKSQLTDAVKNKRSFATIGFKWSVNSRKNIFILSKDGCFDDYEEIKHVAKHEFGHALGLGDLYASASDSLKGVNKGTFAELDSYAINDNFYNLVMCDHHGPISNNDIEMVILAFRENEQQLYQPGRLKRKISSALGKGN
ncbi:MAG: hypothetical protein IJE14_04110 [Clostridia bacterium]|nr:hypothetical protein [Clostridia bacterium]